MYGANDLAAGNHQNGPDCRIAHAIKAENDGYDSRSVAVKLAPRSLSRFLATSGQPAAMLDLWRYDVGRIGCLEARDGQRYPFGQERPIVSERQRVGRQPERWWAISGFTVVEPRGPGVANVTSCNSPPGG